MSQRIADKVRERLPAGTLYDDDRLTPRLIREGLFAARSNHMHYAAIALLFAASPTSAQTYQFSQVGAAQVKVFQLKYATAANVDTIMARAARANFNVVFFQVRGAGDAFYSSPLEPCAVALCGSLGNGQPPWDPLAVAVAALGSSIDASLAAVAQAVVSIVRRNPPVKAMFNVAQWSFAAGAGAVAYRAFRSGTELDAHNVAALIAAIIRSVTRFLYSSSSLPGDRS